MIIKICITSTLERRERLQRSIHHIRNHSNYPHMIVLYEDEERNGCIGPTRKILSSIKEDDLVIVLNDDMVPEPNWLKILVEAYLKAFPNLDGLAQPEDTIQHGKIATCPMATPKFLLEHWRPEYNHLYGDEELTLRAKMLGKYIYVPESVVVHEHPSRGFALNDPNYHLGSRHYEHDFKVFEERRKNNFYL